MSQSTAIEWTDATWNPVRGCSIVSKGCTNCYAMRQAHRSNRPGGAYEGLTKLTRGGPVWTGAVREVDELLTQPLKWRRPRRIFVNSMSDLFHENVHGDFIDAILDTVARSNHLGLGHQFQVLTKRAERMYRFMRHYRPIANLWLGVSVEDQIAADERIPFLLQTPATVRWISAEPLLGPIDLRAHHPLRPRDGGAWTMLDWVVVGGESGPGARPMHPDWARALRDQCGEFGIAFFFKQWGAWAPYTYVNASNGHKLVRLGYTKTEEQRERVIGGPTEGTEPYNVRRVGKKAAGRELDGRTHDEYPA
jgi:protein gp37